MKFEENPIKLLYWAIRYGEWSWDWEMYKDKPMFGLFFGYYDGYCFSFHLYKLCICAIHF